MKEFFNFLQEYWKLIVIISLDLLLFFVGLIKKNVKLINSPLTITLEKLPGWIKIAENMFGSQGKVKKDYVMDLALNYYKSIGGLSNITSSIDLAIEEILSTPQKKKGD